MLASRSILLPLTALAVVTASLVAQAQFHLDSATAPGYPALNPPHVDLGIEPGPERIPRSTGTPSIEWTLHKTANGVHPSGEEQRMIWLMNRARQDPPAEGLWLATLSDPNVAYARDVYSNVNLSVMKSEFASYAPKPPAASDARLYAAAKAHADSLIVRDAQDHVGQYEQLAGAGFHPTAYRGNAFSYSMDGLYAHAGLNIDWTNQTADGMQVGRLHRLAIMALDGDYTNVGIAFVPEGNNATLVGPNVMVGDYAGANTAFTDHHNKFLVGTVWEDGDGDGLYDPGEGIGGVEVMPDRGTYYAVTGNAGGYAIPVDADGVYNIAFTGGALAPCGKSVSVSGSSLLVDYQAGDADCGPVVEGPLLVTNQTFTGVDVLSSPIAITAKNSVLIKASANITFSAPIVTLQAGFRAASGSHFLATQSTMAARPITSRSVESPSFSEPEPSPAGVPTESAESAARRAAPNELPATLQRILDQAGATPQDVQRDAAARLFVFSTTTALDAADNNRLADVYLYDDAALELELLSATPAGLAGSGASAQPRMDAAGERVVFASAAPDLVGDDGEAWTDIFLYRIALRTLERITGAEAGHALNPALAATADRAEVFHELQGADGLSLIRRINLVGGTPAGVAVAEANGGDSFLPAVTDDGRYLAWINRSIAASTIQCEVRILDRDTRQVAPLPQDGALCQLHGYRPAFSTDASAILWLEEPMPADEARSPPPEPMTNPLAR